jgi:hypothetical protein
VERSRQNTLKEIKSMGRVYTVQQGDCLSSIAREFGFPSYQTIYDDPNNADFRSRRPNPNVILPGDRIHIPDRLLKWVSGSTEVRHQFRVRRPRTMLRLVAVDALGRPLRGRSYTLTVEGKVVRGQTGADGLIETEIDGNAARGRLSVAGNDAHDPPFARDLFLGHVDPITEVSGVQGRLNNLGFECGAMDGVAGPRTTAAVAAFQRRHGLEVDGAINPATRDKLLQIHGS